MKDYKCIEVEAINENMGGGYAFFNANDGAIARIQPVQDGYTWTSPSIPADLNVYSERSAVEEAVRIVAPDHVEGFMLEYDGESIADMLTRIDCMLAPLADDKDNSLLMSELRSYVTKALNVAERLKPFKAENKEKAE